MEYRNNNSDRDDYRLEHCFSDRLLVADADRLLELARQAWVELPEDSVQRQSIVAGAELLGQLLLQDIERKSGDADGDADDGVSLKDGVSKDRMLSVLDAVGA